MRWIHYRIGSGGTACINAATIFRVIECVKDETSPGGFRKPMPGMIDGVAAVIESTGERTVALTADQWEQVKTQL